VRDALLGHEPVDLDVEVAGTSFEDLLKVLSPFGATDVVGRSFGTIKLRMHGKSYDFSLPRRESKNGAGHRGFHIQPDPTLSDADAAARRDFTINAIAWDPFTETIIDPHGGERDLRLRILRHTSEAFVEDPLRVLRGMQFAARFDFHMADETVRLCRSISPTYHELATERIWAEWAKWASRSIRPSCGLNVLLQTGWLKHFPEIQILRGILQDSAWHPEGDVFVHTQHCLDALVRSPGWTAADDERRWILTFAVLAHDFGKASTSVQVEKLGQLRWTSPGHAAAGIGPTESFLNRIGAPLRIAPAVAPLVLFHMALHDSSGPPSDTHVRRLARRLAPSTIEDLAEVMLADARGRPPKSAESAELLVNTLLKRATALTVNDNIPQPIVQGRHLVARGLLPGPTFSPILLAAFEAQLDGAFFDEAGSSLWLDSHLKNRNA
jgi:tRNA nucleotidyltransferase (CCA-adding enzyme)